MPSSRGIFSTQGSNSSLLFFLLWQAGSLPLVLPRKTHYCSKKRKWKLYLTLCDPMDLVHGILQAGILEWVAFPFSRESSQLRNWTGVSCIAVGFFTNWTNNLVKGGHFLSNSHVKNSSLSSSFLAEFLSHKKGKAAFMLMIVVMGENTCSLTGDSFRTPARPDCWWSYNGPLFPPCSGELLCAGLCSIKSTA